MNPNVDINIMSPLINQAGIDTKIRLNLTVKEKWVEQEAEARII